MLGFAGFAVLEAREVDGDVELVVETTARRVGCPECGVIASAHDRREVVVRDGSVFERRGRLRWRKRVWRCREAACAKRTWTEQHPAVAPRASLTQRVRAAACRRVGAGGESVAAVARDLGVGLAHGVAGGGRPRPAVDRRPRPPRGRRPAGDGRDRVCATRR